MFRKLFTRKAKPYTPQCLGALRTALDRHSERKYVEALQYFFIAVYCYGQGTDLCRAVQTNLMGTQARVKQIQIKSEFIIANSADCILLRPSGGVWFTLALWEERDRSDLERKIVYTVAKEFLDAFIPMIRAILEQHK